MHQFYAELVKKSSDFGRFIDIQIVGSKISLLVWSNQLNTVRKF